MHHPPPIGRGINLPTIKGEEPLDDRFKPFAHHNLQTLFACLNTLSSGFPHPILLSVQYPPSRVRTRNPRRVIMLVEHRDSC